jgi:hypothetical protein
MFFLEELLMKTRDSNNGGRNNSNLSFGFKEQDPNSEIADDVRKLIISLIVEYQVKYNQYITALEVWEAFHTHPSIRNHTDYKFYLLMMLPNCPIKAKLDVDNDGNIIVIQPE